MLSARREPERLSDPMKEHRELIREGVSEKQT